MPSESLRDCGPSSRLDNQLFSMRLVGRCGGVSGVYGVEVSCDTICHASVLYVTVYMSMSVQMLHLEEELNNIERIVRRVEVANDKTQHHSSSGIVITPPSDTHHPSRSQLSSYGYAEAVTAPRADLMVDLIQQYSDLIASIERAATKHVNVQVRCGVDE